MEVLHLDYRPGTAGWVLRLQARLQHANSHVLRERYARWKELGLADLGIAVATRISLTLRVGARMGELIKALRDEIDASGKVDELIDGGFVYSPVDPRIFYDICVCVDSFYFEFRSAYEVLGKFIKVFSSEILAQAISERQILDVVKTAGVDLAWVDSLRDTRKLFFHETAPWIALQIRTRRPLECSILVMKENLHTFEDPTKYITQQQLVDTIVAFQKSVSVIFEWLDREVAAFDATTGETARL